MKLMLADDLRSAHRYLENCLDWQAEGITEFLHAYDGGECVALVEQYRPEILLLDIKMPICDGLEVLRILSERDIMPYVLFISAYGEFQYARQALKYGVSDYLMKPVNPETLRESIRAVTGKIRQQCLDHLRSYLLDLPVDGGQTDLWQEADILGLNNINCVMVVFSGNIPRISEITGILSEKYPNSIALSNTSLFIILPAGTETDSPHLSDLEKQLEVFAQEETIHLNAGISQRLNIRDNGLQLAYNQCSDAVTCRFHSGEVIFHYRDLAFANISQETVNQSRLDLTKAMLEYGEERIAETVDRVFQAFSEDNPGWRQLVDACYSTLIYCINYLFISYNSLSLEASERELLARLEACRSVEQLRDVFLTVLLQNMSGAENSRVSKKSELISSIEKYLQQNYMNALTLESMSTLFFLSKYELCRRFKAEVGENLWEYISNLRISRAKQLLLNSSLRISEISSKVGYRDPTYFSNSFKKQVGMSPKVYRAQSGKP